MDTPTQPALTRRDLLKYALGGSAVVLLAPLAEGNASATTLDRNLRAVGQSAKGGKRGGTLKFARSIAPTTLDPANTIIAGDIYTLDKILEPLYVTNPAGHLVPWLASGYAVSADHKTFTFALRPGVKFSDGKPLVADDVVFSINRSRTNSAGPLSFLDFAITSIEAKGTDNSRGVQTVAAVGAVPLRHFRVRERDTAGQLRRPERKGLLQQAHWYRAVHAIGLYAGRQFTDPETQPHLLAEPGKPYLDSVEFLYVDNDNQRVLQAQGGEVDIIDTVPPANVASLRSSSGLWPSSSSRPGRSTCSS